MKVARLSALLVLTCVALLSGPQMVQSEEPEQVVVGDCGGGSCYYAGVSLNCPTSGTPGCSSGQSCTCDCNGGSPINKCVNAS